MADLSVPMDEPYFDSTIALLTNEIGTIVGLDGKPYLLDNANGLYSSQSIDVVQQRNTNDARDQLLLPQEVWRQSQSGWQQGAGQTNADREDSLPYRFDTSYGIDVWEPWQVQLLHRTERLCTVSGGQTFLGVHNGDLVIANGSALLWYDGLPGASTSLSAGSASIISMTYDGDAIITLHSGGQVWKSTGPASTSLFGSFPGTTFIEYVKDYLIAGTTNVLNDITSGSVTAIYTAPTPGFRWVGACEGNENIYLLGGSGDRWLVHRVGIANDGTGLQPAIVAATLPVGEVGSCIGSYLGFIFIGTSNGVRMATANADGSLTLGPLIPTGSPVRDFEGQGRFVWYTDSAIDGRYEANGATLGVFPAGTVAGLGRMDLSTFTVADNAPAYANDIVSDLTTGAVKSIVTFEGKRVFSINGEAVYYEHDEYMPAGWINEGVVTFGVEDTKTGLYIQSRWLPLAGSVVLDTAVDGNEWKRLATRNVQGSVSSGNVALQGVQFGRIQGRILLAATDDLTDTPVVTRWEVRARAVVGSAVRWSLPIIVAEVLNFDNRIETRDAAQVVDELMDLVISGRMFILQEGGKAYHVVVRQFKWNPQAQAQMGDSWQGVFQLVVDQVV